MMPDRDPEAFRDGHWHMEDSGKRSVHYIAGGHFYETGTAFEASADLSGTGNNAG